MKEEIEEGMKDMFCTQIQSDSCQIKVAGFSEGSILSTIFPSATISPSSGFYFTKYIHLQNQVQDSSEKFYI